jgi:hypothetical protein
MADDNGDRIKIDFSDLPFFFDENGTIRCTKCHSAGWIIDDVKKSGVEWEDKSDRSGGDPNPDNWTKVGEYDRSKLTESTWQHMVEELWRQNRHLGKQRALFLGALGGVSVLGVAFGIFSSSVDQTVRSGIFLGLFVFYMFQGVLSIKIAKAYSHNVEHLDLLAAIAPKEIDSVSFSMLRPMQGMEIRGKWVKIQISRLIPIFYFVLGLVWLALAIIIMY